MFSLLPASVFLPMALWMRAAVAKLDQAGRTLALLAPLLGEAATRLATALH